MRYYIAVFLCIFTFTLSYAQRKHEIRAAWLTTVYGLDFPSVKATSPLQVEEQKRELINILDKLQEANFNTVLFQTRSRGDVFYRSSIEPFNAVLTGRAGKDPGYDPLQFVVEECHKRGMECHAWIVTIPLGSNKHVNSLGKNALPKKHRSMCVSFKNSWYLNPGSPQTKNYLAGIVREIVTKYDVDGIHFDYIRYPEGAERFADNKEFKLYGKGRNKKQWRRDNLTEIVRTIYGEVKVLKPWVKVSSSPLGKYRDTSRFSSRGWNAYHAVSQETQRWLAEGIHDQVYPMLYYRGDDFYPFALDWQEQSNGRHIVPGLGIYFLHPSEGNWNRSDILRQINFIRRAGMAGQAYYRVGFLMDNTQQLYDVLADNYYVYPALQPPMPWLDDVPPTPPADISIEKDGGYYTLSWTASSDNDLLNPPRYIVYASDTYPVDITNPENILAQGIQKNSFIYAPVFPWETKSNFAVTAVDRYGNESVATQVVIP